MKDDQEAASYEDGQVCNPSILLVKEMKGKLVNIAYISLVYKMQLFFASVTWITMSEHSFAFIAPKTAKAIPYKPRFATCISPFL
jgi:hypothetical protein